MLVLHEGKVVDSGSYQDLLVANNLTNLSADSTSQLSVSNSGPTIFGSLMKSFFDSVSDGSSTAVATTADRSADIATPTRKISIDRQVSKPNNSEGKLVVAEDREVGNVSVQVYLKWLSSAGGMFVMVVLIGLICLSETTSVASGWWISQFSSSYSRYVCMSDTNLGMYALHTDRNVTSRHRA